MLEIEPSALVNTSRNTPFDHGRAVKLHEYVQTTRLYQQKKERVRKKKEDDTLVWMLHVPIDAFESLCTVTSSCSGGTLCASSTRGTIGTSQAINAICSAWCALRALRAWCSNRPINTICTVSSVCSVCTRSTLWPLLAHDPDQTVSAVDSSGSRRALYAYRRERGLRKATRVRKNIFGGGSGFARLNNG